MIFEFSVILAADSEIRHLQNSMQSLMVQDIGFENIQIIITVCGDGCDEYATQYPNNVVVIHESLSRLTARNAAITHICGRYTVFMDAGDIFASETLSLVQRFWGPYRDMTDVVCVPVIYNDSKDKRAGLSREIYKTEAHIIDLEKDPDAFPTDVSGVFIRSEALRNQYFDTEMPCIADTKLLLRIIARKQTLGVIPQGCCRVRAEGKETDNLKADSDPNQYISRLQKFWLDTAEYCRHELGLVPKSVQYVIMNDVQWVIRLAKFPHALLSAEEESEFRVGLRQLFGYFDDEVILAQKQLNPARKVFILHEKYGRDPQWQIDGDDLWMSYDGKPFARASEFELIIDFIRMTPDSCIVEGRTAAFPFASANISVTAILGGKEQQSTEICSRDPITVLGDPVLCYRGFRIEHLFSISENKVELQLRLVVNGVGISPRKLTFGAYSGLSASLYHSYYTHAGWCVQNRRTSLVFERINSLGRCRRELLFMWELLFGRKKRSRSGAFYRMAYHFMRLMKRKPLWLISDREGSAGDNGEAFFRYMVAEHPEIDTRFILLKDSPDYRALAEIGKVVQADSKRRKLLSLISDYVISSQAEPINCRPFAPKDIAFLDIMADYRFVFLQHGITKDDISQWLRKTNKNIYGFVTAAKPEYDSIVNGRYGYAEEQIWLTGFPRFDRLISQDSPRQITIMPTWRRYLMGELDGRTGVWTLSPQFRDGSFFRFYDALLNDTRLIHAAKQYGYSLGFFPHPNLKPHMSVFRKNENVIFLGPETTYRDVYAKSALVITDYSSAVFDFAYMRRPVIYTQFDREEFFGGGHMYTEGYFDYERDGFGEVETGLDGTVDRIIEYMASGCRMKREYRERADNFFAFSDRENCRRVYDKISGNT